MLRNYATYHTALQLYTRVLLLTDKPGLKGLSHKNQPLCRYLQELFKAHSINYVEISWRLSGILLSKDPHYPKFRVYHAVRLESSSVP